MLINSESLFLIFLGLVWIIGAVLQDLKRREVDNLWNFSLVAFALAYRAGVSIFNSDYWFLLNGLIGFALFLLIGNIFYYSRVFAGGDAKLLMALGSILPLSYSWIANFEIFIVFVFSFLVFGSIYALIYSFFLILFNKKLFLKEFKKQWKLYNKLFLTAFAFVIVIILSAFLINRTSFILIGFVVLLFPVLFVFAKAVEESCMIKEIPGKFITEGDWLYKDIVINGRKISSSWEGVTKKELSAIRKSRKKILIKQGIPFTPGFLLAFIFTLIFFKYRLWFFGLF